MPLKAVRKIDCNNWRIGWSSRLGGSYTPPIQSLLTRTTPVQYRPTRSPTDTAARSSSSGRIWEMRWRLDHLGLVRMAFASARVAYLEAITETIIETISANLLKIAGAHVPPQSCSLQCVYAQFTLPARHDKPVLSVSCLVWRCEWDNCNNVFRLHISCRRQSCVVKNPIHTAEADTQSGLF